MKFSIVIPVYNTATYLEACVRSVTDSTFQDYEILLVDDGSTDDVSPALCDRLAAERPDRIRVVHQKNLGLGGARNTGIEAAAGDWLLFLDSDDTLTPDALPILAEASVTEAEIIAFYTRSVTEDGVLLDCQLHHVPAGASVTLSQCPWLLLDTPSACARLWRKELFLRTGIRFPQHLRYEDLHTTGKLLLEAKGILGVEKALYLYLQRGGSIMHGANPDCNAEVITALESVRGWFHEQGQSEKYGPWLDSLVLLHIYDATLRALRLSPQAPVLERLQAYLREAVPHCTRCPVYSRQSLTWRMILWCMRHGHYTLLARLFALKNQSKSRRDRA